MHLKGESEGVKKVWYSAHNNFFLCILSKRTDIEQLKLFEHNHHIFNKNIYPLLNLKLKPVESYVYVLTTNAKVFL